MNSTTKKLIALSIAVPGIVAQADCPLSTCTDNGGIGAGFSADSWSGDSDQNIYAAYSGAQQTVLAYDYWAECEEETGDFHSWFNSLSTGISRGGNYINSDYSNARAVVTNGVNGHAEAEAS